MLQNPISNKKCLLTRCNHLNLEKRNITDTFNSFKFT